MLANSSGDERQLTSFFAAADVDDFDELGFFLLKVSERIAKNGTMEELKNVEDVINIGTIEGARMTSTSF